MVGFKIIYTWVEIFILALYHFMPKTTNPWFCNHETIDLPDEKSIKIVPTDRKHLYEHTKTSRLQKPWNPKKETYLCHKRQSWILVCMIPFNKLLV